LSISSTGCKEREGERGRGKEYGQPKSGSGLSLLAQKRKKVEKLERPVVICIEGGVEHRERGSSYSGLETLVRDSGRIGTRTKDTRIPEPRLGKTGKRIFWWGGCLSKGESRGGVGTVSHEQQEEK